MRQRVCVHYICISMNRFCRYLVLCIAAVLLCWIDGCHMKEATYCLTTANGTTCGDGSHIRLTRIDGHQAGFQQGITLNDGRDVTLKTLSMKPLVVEIEKFLTEAECDYFVKLAKQEGLKNSATQANSGQQKGFRLMDVNKDRKLDINEMISTIEGGFDVYLEESDIKEMYRETNWDSNNDGFITQDETENFSPLKLREYLTDLIKKKPEKHSRYSKQVWLYPDSSTDPVFSNIQQRVSNVTRLPAELMTLSDFQVVSYGVKGHYNAHFDSGFLAENTQCCTRERTKQCRICRYMTILFYLNDVEGGGETAFPTANNETANLLKVQEDKLMNLYKKCEEANLLVSPTKGKAILWYNHMVNEDNGWLGEQDHFTLHGGCPVTSGTKWIANFWIKVTDDKIQDLKKMIKIYKKNKEKSKSMSKHEKEVKDEL